MPIWVSTILVEWASKVRTSYRSYLNFEFLGHFTTFDDLEGWEYQGNRTSNDFYAGLRIGYNHMFY